MPWLRRLVAGVTAEARARSQTAPCQFYGRRSPGSITDRSMLVLWWIKWHWNRLFYKYLGFPPSVTFHQCPILVFILILSSPKNNQAKSETLQAHYLSDINTATTKYFFFRLLRAKCHKQTETCSRITVQVTITITDINFNKPNNDEIS